MYDCSLLIFEILQDFVFPKNKIIIQSGGDFNQYMHLTQDKAMVTAGENVSRGQLLVYKKVTGISRYPHLHFE